MKKIKLKNTKLKSLVDNEIFIWASKEIWSLQNGKYAVRCSCIKINNQWFTKKIYLHREIIKVTGNFHVDHINGNTLDNRKKNLRICSRSENLYNRGKAKHNTSGYKGVNWCKQRRNWRARIFVNKKEFYLGCFDNKINAAKAYDEASIKYHGEFAKLNFKK